MSAKSSKKRAQNIVQPIYCGSILSNSNHDRYLFGNPPRNGNFFHSLVVISSFIRKHQFLSTDAGAGAGAGAGSGALSVQTYARLIKEFEISQLERQAAGLRSNTNAASASDLQNIIDCHCDALKDSLNSVSAHGPLLTVTNLKAIHAKMCPPNQAGRGAYRDNRVRASNTLFVHPTNIPEEMDHFISAVQRLQDTLANTSIVIMDENQWVSHVYNNISLVAIIMFGINDIHPFRDGNGRTSRIFMNMALKRFLGLPFPVTVTAQNYQRREYVDALKECRSRLQRISNGENLAAGQTVFEHLIEVVADRVLHAVVQVNSLIEAKAQSAAADEEARVARAVREKAAAGQCAICLDENPNIATLCCGVAVHLNCLSEWLSNQGTCITCRKAMPQIIPRAVQRQDGPNANASNNDNAEEMTEDTTDTTTTTTDDDNSTEDDTTSDNNDTTEDTTDTLDDTTGDTTEDDTTSDDDNNTNEDDTTDTTDDTESVGNATAVQSVFCIGCQKNKFAVDCSNKMCGRCCGLYGQFSCSRHYC